MVKFPCLHKRAGALSCFSAFRRAFPYLTFSLPRAVGGGVVCRRGDPYAHRFIAGALKKLRCNISAAECCVLCVVALFLLEAKRPRVGWRVCAFLMCVVCVFA